MKNIAQASTDLLLVFEGVVTAPFRLGDCPFPRDFYPLPRDFYSFPVISPQIGGVLSMIIIALAPRAEDPINQCCARRYLMRARYALARRFFCTERSHLLLLPSYPYVFYILFCYVLNRI